MEASGREKDAAGPPWAPSRYTVFRSYAATVGVWAEAQSARGNGVAARSSNLRAVRKRPLVTRLTRDILQTFEKCNPEFVYSDSLNPKRFLTNPSVAVHNDGLDNANSDLIMYVNLELVNKKSDRRYIVQEMLGQGTFGQVAKCWDAETSSYVAVKVIKNQPAFYQQAIMEVSLLSMLNDRFDPDDQHHIVRMLDFFPWKNHLCIAFEMLGHNLYELLKKNSLRGLQLKYVRTFSRQILDALVVMKGAGIIHCDLKPENILITPNVKSAAGVKVIDFGSACMEGKTIYSYIQSRYYRSPEVLLGYPYTTAIDMWSFGCIVAELYIGLPLFPGASEYDVLSRMIEIIGGQPPDDLLREAKNTRKFFKHIGSIYSGNGAHDGLGSAYRILTEDEVEARDSKKPKIGKWYFPRGRLDRLIFAYPWKNLNEGDLPEAEKADCLALVDFLRGLVEFDPNKRWSPLQASYHPFITGEAFTGPYEPFRETPIIPVGRAAAVDHNPGGGHWLAAGLSPQVGSINRSLPFNNVFPPKMPLSYGSSYGSFGSHGSFNDNVGPAISYGSYDAHNINMYHSPMGPSGFNLQSQAGGTFLGFSPDIRRRHHLSHGGGIRSSPGGPGPMSLGASPSQFTPPNSQMQIPTSTTAKYVSTSPARGGHGSSMGKAAQAGQYNRRRNPGHPPMSMPPHEYTSQPIQGHHGNGVSSAFARGHSGYSYGAVPNSSHYNWRPQIGFSTGLSTKSSSNHGYVQPSNYNDFRPLHSSNVSADTLASASSVPDPADWDPNYSDESLLQENNSLSAELGSLHLRDASVQTIGSSRLLDIQSHEIASSNPSSMNQRTTGWTACVKGMFKRDIKEKNRDSDDSGTLLTTLEMQGATNEENKKRQNAYIKKIGPWGGDGGLYRDTKVEFVCLKSIKICSGQYVHSLEFSYSDENGMERHAGPWGICDILTSRVLNKIQLGREEFLTGISGTIDTSNYYGTNIISSLTFITNVSQYGPFGSPGQISFRSPPMSSNSRIVGFFGRSGDLVDAIGLYVKLEREPMDKHDLITKVGPWGGTSGPYHDVDMVPRRLISVVICSGKVIHSLTFIYNDGDGRQHTAGPWGGLGTSKKGAFHTIMLGRSEIVKEVSGTVGPSTVTSLSFVTNIATYGPFGHGEGTPFCSPVQDNDSIVGFFAKAEQHINAIGFYLASTENQDNDGAACTNPHLGDGIKKLDKEFITKIGPWGGCKGNRKDIEAAHLCLNNITIRSGEVVYSLAFSYKEDNGKQHHAGPWGASEGFSYGSFDTIQLGSSEFLTGVSGTIGSSSKYSSNVLTEVSGTTDFSSHYSSDVVTSVIFITNVGRYGPYGGGGGIPFHSPMLSSGSIVGFFAHADRVIDAIGIYVNPEREPTQEQDSVVKIGPWGGDSGRPNDVDALPRHLISVVVHSGDIINSLAFTYLDSDGHEHTAGPWGRMGEPIDGSSHKILLGQSDFLMEVSGTIGPSSQYSDVVTSLFFITNTGSYGPYGKVGGTRFRSPNGSIVGFFVSAEDVIDAIGVYFSLERVTPKEQVEGGSQISMGMTNIIMDSRDRVAIKPESIILEHMLLDRNVEPANVPLALLQHITEDFDVQRVIGVGGFATVYKADLKNGSVAIKKLSNAHTIDERLFYREATCLISVKHDNIVRFLGYCANTELQAMPHPDPKETPKFIFAEIRERLLCFEYMKNGSLDKYLTDELRGLEWHIRYNIIKGICNGLDYLHNEKSIIHRDLKPANILVDDLMVPKITDFGISKLLEGATHAVTTDPAMSLGYTAPEFIDRHEVSFRSDLFSLGVIIMELVTGRKGDRDINNVCRRWRHRWNKSAKYPPFGYQQVTKCVEIASMCLSDSPNKRPSVRDILNVLNTIENTDVQINSSSESLVGPISPYPWELLDFDKLELNFPFEINKQIPCSLELTNVTNDYVAFNIQNTGTEYCIEPNKGVVPARSKCIVIVTLQARKEVPNAMMCKGEFVVRCAAVNEGLTADDIHEDMFNIKSGKLVDEVPLTVVILCVGAGT